jgi:hypothetical protein
VNVVHIDGPNVGSLRENLSESFDIRDIVRIERTPRIFLGIEANGGLQREDRRKKVAERVIPGALLVTKWRIAIVYRVR